MRAEENFSFHHLGGLKRVIFAQISPNGRQVAFVLDALPEGKGERRDQLWLVDSRTGKHSVIAETLDIDWIQAPYILQWSPDGSRLLYGGRPEELFMMDLATSASRRLTAGGDWILRANWSPDGRTIALVTAKPSSTPVPFVGGEALRILDPVNGESHALDLDGLAPGEPSWSPDGQSLAFAAKGDIYSVKFGEKPRLLVARPGPDDRPSFSPDGKRIAFMSRVGPNGGRSTLSLVAASGGEPDDVGAGIDMGLGRAPARYFAWAPDGRSILFSKFERMAHALYRLDLDSRRIVRITPAERADIGFSIARDGRSIAFISSNAQTPNELYVARTAPYAERRLTFSNPQLASVRMPTSQRLEWRSPDGLEVEGLLMLPPGYDPTKSYPLIVVMEGSYGAFDLSFSTRAVADSDLLSPLQRQLLASDGYVLLMPNPRGSWSYGWDFAAKALGDFGVGPNADINAGIDELVRRGIADPKRVGIMGMYLDGYRAFYAMTHSDRFGMAVVVNGMFDLRSAYGQGAADLLRSFLGGNPWEKREAYQQLSPFEMAPRYRTPTLLIALTGDPFPNEAQAAEAATALDENRVPHSTRSWPIAAFFSNGPPWMNAVKAIEDWAVRFLKRN